MADDDEEEPDEAPLTPDGGFGWVIVACVFMITFLSFGIPYSIGIIFDVLIADFDCTKAEVSVVASIAFSLQCFLGPFISILQQRYPTRLLVFVGVIIIAVALISSAFAPSLFVLYFTFGVLGGTGMALVYLPVNVMITFYFNRRRSLATALGGIGAYVGAFIHPYLIRFLVSWYSWRGALFLLGALELNSLAASILLRPVEKELGAAKDRLPIKNITSDDVEIIQSKPQSPPEQLALQQSDSGNALTAFIEANIAGCQQLDSADRLGSLAERDEGEGEGERHGSADGIVEPDEDTFGTGPTGTLTDDEESAPFEYPNANKYMLGDEASHHFVQPASLPVATYGRSVSLTARQESTNSDMTPKRAKRRIGGAPGLSQSQRMQPRSRLVSGSSQAAAVESKHGGSVDRAQSPGANQRQFVRMESAGPSSSYKKSFNRLVSKVSQMSSFSNLYSSDLLALSYHQADSQVALEQSGGLGEARPLRLSTARQRSRMSESRKQVEELPLEDLRETPEQATTPADKTDAVLETFLEEAAVKAKAHQLRAGKRVLKVIKPYFGHFTNAKFTAFFVTNFMKGIIYYTPSMFIVGWGKQLGMSIEETTLLISLVGIGNIIGRPVMAFVSDLLAPFRIALLAAMVFVNGCFTIATPLLPNFYYLAFFVFQFAFFIGGGQTLLTPILADMVPLNQLAFAFGLLIAAEGAAILIGPPLLGLFPSYETTFAASGLIMISSAIVLVVVAFIGQLCRRCCGNKRQSTAVDQPNEA